VAVTNAISPPSLNPLKKRLTSLRAWFCINSLALTPEKSEAVFLGRDARLWSGLCFNVSSIDVAGTAVYFSSTIKTLGVTFDSMLSLDEHVGAICKASYYHKHVSRHIRASVTE
jgi:hypothetical protein